MIKEYPAQSLASIPSWQNPVPRTDTVLSVPVRTRPGPERGASRIRVPAETVLTPRVLVGAGRKLSDAELEQVIDALIAEMDARTGDPDLEPEDWT